MPYFEMSLENGREYVYQNDSSVVESDLGMWMVVFLDVDWGDQIKKLRHSSVERSCLSLVWAL